MWTTIRYKKIPAQRRDFKIILLYFKYFTSKNNGIKICISTTKSYANETIPKLISQLLMCNVPMENIFVFEGGHSAYSKNESARYNHYYTDHNSFDLTSLISILENTSINEIDKNRKDMTEISKDSYTWDRISNLYSNLFKN